MLQLDGMPSRFKENSGGCSNSCAGYYTSQAHRLRRYIHLLRRYIPCDVISLFL